MQQRKPKRAAKKIASAVTNTLGGVSISIFGKLSPKTYGCGCDKASTLNMNDGNIWTVVELFMVNEAFNRLQLDIGQLFESAKLSPRDVVLRINEMQDYLKSEISSQMQSIRESNANPDSKQLELLVQEALINTFSVYEGTL